YVKCITCENKPSMFMIKIVKDELMNYLKLKKQLEQFLDEDIGNGDVTNCIFDPLETGEIIFLAKEDGIFCGREVIRTGYNILDHGSNVNIYVQDGQRIQKGQTIGAVNGSIANLLQGERIILTSFSEERRVGKECRERRVKDRERKGEKR